MQNVALHTEAANGITRVVLQGAGIFDGSLFGEALLSMAKVPSLRSDLLIHGLSLRQLCASFPAIKGYIAGAVDGIVSLKTEEGGMQGLSGFTHLWARETNREPMTISREFLQRLSGKKLSGFFFRNDRPYDHAEIVAMLKEGYLSFETLDIRHTNLFGVRDLSVSIAATQNRIALDHLLSTIREAATRGKPAVGTNSASEEKKPEQPPVEMEFKWQE